MPINTVAVYGPAPPISLFLADQFNGNHQEPKGSSRRRLRNGPTEVDCPAPERKDLSFRYLELSVRRSFIAAGLKIRHFLALSPTRHRPDPNIRSMDAPVRRAFPRRVRE